MTMPITYYEVMTFESKSSKTGKCYTVKRRVDTGALSCDCPQWVFNRNGDRTCYHTERVKVLRIVEDEPLYLPKAVVGASSVGPITEQPRKLRMKEGGS